MGSDNSRKIACQKAKTVLNRRSGWDLLYNAFVQKVIIAFFEKRKGIAAVYFFGSRAKNKETRQSDVDIALLYESGSVPDFRSKLEIQEALSAKLKKEVDVVILNKANPILKYQVLKHGKLLLNNNLSAVNAFFVRSIMEYDDIKRIRAPIEKNMLRGRVYGR